jgi:hypothetical protein
MENWRLWDELPAKDDTYQVILARGDQVYMKYANGQWHSYDRERETAAKSTSPTWQEGFRWLVKAAAKPSRPVGMYKWGNWYGWWTGTELMSCQGNPSIAYEQFKENKTETVVGFMTQFWKGAELINWKPEPKPKPETKYKTPTIPGVYKGTWARNGTKCYARWNGKEWSNKYHTPDYPDWSFNHGHQDFDDWTLVKADTKTPKPKPEPESKPEPNPWAKWPEPKPEPNPWAEWAEPGVTPRSPGVYQVSVHKRHSTPVDWHSYWDGFYWHAAYSADSYKAWTARNSPWAKSDGEVQDIRFRRHSCWLPKEPETPIKEVAVSKAAAPRRKAPAQRRILLIT